MSAKHVKTACPQNDGELERNGEWYSTPRLPQSELSPSIKTRTNLCLLPVSCYFAGGKYLDRNNYLQDENNANNNQLLYPKHGHV